MKNWVLVQSRSGSKRLPKKCSAILHDKIVVQHVYERCKQASDDVLFIIPEGDYYLMTVLEREMIPYASGHPTDLIARYMQAAKLLNIERFARITADCPFIPPEYITHSFYLMDKYKADFVSNCMEPCVDGFEVEVMNMKTLQWLDKNAVEGQHREHVTTWIKDNPDYSGLKIHSWSSPYDVNLFPKMSIDTKGDLNACRKMLIPKGKI